MSEYIGEVFDSYYLVDRINDKIYLFGSNTVTEVDNYDISENRKSISSFISSEKEMEQINIEGKEYIAVNSHFSDDSISLIMMADATSYINGKKSAVVFSTLLLLVVLFLSIFASSYISWRFHQPIDVVINLLKNPTPKVVTEYKESYEHLDELGIISTLINETRFREAMLRDELESKKEILDNLQKKLLQTQINPHFINNTLETINWKAIELLDDDNEISEMLSNFSKLLRRSFRDLGKMVTISSELEHAKLYIDFQLKRFQNRFSVIWDIDKKLMQYYTVPIIIQPLLENAIKYGIKTLRNSKGLIKISCKRKNDNIEFIISDNGEVLSDKQFNSILSQLKTENLNTDNHIGISNVQQRIKLAFGEQYGLIIQKNNISKSDAKGIIVSITIPIVKKSIL